MKGIHRAGGSEMQTTCPQCGKEKLYVSLRKRLGYCFYCGKGFSQDEVRRLGMDDEVQAFTAVINRDNQHINLVSPETDADARAYLAKRKVRAKDCSSFIMYSPELRRLFFRIWSPNSAAYAPAYHTRSIDPGKGWMCSPGVQKAHYWFGHRGGEVITVVEGIFDAISLHHRGVVAVALLGTQMSETQLAGLLEWNPLQQVVVWMDDDEAGRKASDRICAQLEPVVRSVVQVTEHPEPSESSDVPEECYAIHCHR
jgi:DNA primase